MLDLPRVGSPVTKPSISAQRRLASLEALADVPEIEMEIEDITSELKNLRNRLHRACAIAIDLLCHLAIAPRTGATVQFDWISHFHNGVAAKARPEWYNIQR